MLTLFTRQNKTKQSFNENLESQWRNTLNRKVSGTLNIYVKMMLVFAIHFEKFYIIGFLFCAHDKQSFIVKIEPLWRMFCKRSRWPTKNPFIFSYKRFLLEYDQNTNIFHSMYILSSVARFGEISPLWQKF